MAVPPKSTPHSDIDGVHQDERPNVETAPEAGESAENLALARKEGKGYPNYVNKEGQKEG